MAATNSCRAASAIGDEVAYRVIAQVAADEAARADYRETCRESTHQDSAPSGRPVAAR
jgi:hypothetical protein